MGKRVPWAFKTGLRTEGDSQCAVDQPVSESLGHELEKDRALGGWSEVTGTMTAGWEHRMWGQI